MVQLHHTTASGPTSAQLTQQPAQTGRTQQTRWHGVLLAVRARYARLPPSLLLPGLFPSMAEPTGLYLGRAGERL